MITLNLKEQSWKPYEGYGKYGVISSTRFPDYQGFHVSIIDDVTKFEYDRMVGLIHVSPSVRVIQDLKYADDIHYLSFLPGCDSEDFYTYEKKILSKEEALKTLREIFYKLEPKLQVRELRGFDESKGQEYDPNKATGTYLLNDEEIYFITRKNGKVKFEKGGVIIPEYPYIEAKNKHTLAEEDVNYPVYKLSMEYAFLKNQISIHANKYLQSGELGQKVERFNMLEKEIDNKLKNM